MNPRPRLLVVAALGLLACSGSGEGLDRFGRPRESGQDTGINPFFFTEQILEQRCGKCHQGSGAPKGLDLTAGVSYGAIVGVPSKEVPQMLLVAPGASEDSYLWAKLVPDHPAREGSRMPRDGPPYLDQDELAAIQTWIDDGAQQEEE